MPKVTLPPLFRRIQVVSVTEYVVPFSEAETVRSEIEGKTVSELMRDWFNDHPATLPYPPRDTYLVPGSTKVTSIKVGEKERPSRK